MTAIPPTTEPAARSAAAERMVADGKMTELARMKLSEAGRQALADVAINVRAKST